MDTSVNSAIALRFTKPITPHGVELMLRLAGPYIVTHTVPVVYLVCPDDWPAMQQAFTAASIPYDYKPLVVTPDGQVPHLVATLPDPTGWIPAR